MAFVTLGLQSAGLYRGGKADVVCPTSCHVCTLRPKIVVNFSVLFLILLSSWAAHISRLWFLKQFDMLEEVHAISNSYPCCPPTLLSVLSFCFALAIQLQDVSLIVATGSSLLLYALLAVLCWASHGLRRVPAPESPAHRLGYICISACSSLLMSQSFDKVPTIDSLLVNTKDCSAEIFLHGHGLSAGHCCHLGVSKHIRHVFKAHLELGWSYTHMCLHVCTLNLMLRGLINSEVCAVF